MNQDVVKYTPPRKHFPQPRETKECRPKKIHAAAQRMRGVRSGFTPYTRCVTSLRALRDKPGFSLRRGLA